MFANLYLSIVLSAVGFAYFLYGKKSPDFKFLIFGIIIMIYSYFITNIVVALLLGGVLMAAPFIWNRMER